MWWLEVLGVKHLRLSRPSLSSGIKDRVGVGREGTFDPVSKVLSEGDEK